MTNIFDVATYILEKLGSISQIKLQQLCYYSQVWSLVWDSAPLFEENFSLWDIGPICPVLFYKALGQDPVDTNTYRRFCSKTDLTNNQKDTIDKVIDHYGDFNEDFLRFITCMEYPWDSATEDGYCNYSANQITTASMEAYYGKRYLAAKEHGIHD